MKFQIKTAWWIHLIIILLVFELILTITDVYETNEIIMWVFVVITTIILVLFVFPLYFKSYYLLNDVNGILQLRLGFLSVTNIPYKTIRRLAPTKKAFISYAMHYDRLELVYEGPDKNKYTVLVSPKSKEEFIKEIQKRNPDIETNCPLSEQIAGNESLN